MTARTFTVTADDLMRAFRSHQALRFKGTQFYALIVTVLAGITLAYGFNRPGTQYPVFAGGALLYLIVIVIIIRLVVRWIWLPRFVRRIFTQQKEFSQPQTVDWTEDQLFLTSANGQSQLPFGDLHQYARNGDAVLLYRSEALFHILPASAFTDAADRAALIARLDHHHVPCRTAGWQL